MQSLNRNFGNKLKKIRKRFVERWKEKPGNAGPSNYNRSLRLDFQLCLTVHHIVTSVISNELFCVSSSSSSQSCLSWETDNASTDPVFRNLKWTLTSDPQQCDQVISFLLRYC